MRGDGDSWVVCARGHRHWGRYGAAGVLVRQRDEHGDRVVLQHRAGWSHQGDTWGIPGGARDSDESPVHAALREAGEEAGLPAADLRPHGLLFDDHGGWSYTTVLAEPTGPLRPRPTGGESAAVGWVPVAEVDALPLHPGFAATWPRLRAARAGLVLLVDGANVVGARGRGDGWWRDRAGAARRLRDALAALAERGVPARDLPAAAAAPGADVDVLLPRIVLVVEGAARVVAEDPPPAAEAPAGAGPGTGPGTGAAGRPPAGTGTGPGTGPAAGAAAGAAVPVAAVQVVAAPASGDDTIVAQAVAASTAGRPVLAVTADRGLAGRLARVGAPRVGPRWLLDRLE